MIPRSLLRGQPIAFDQVLVGDVIDTYDPIKGDQSRFHRRLNQVVKSAPSQGVLGGCDIYTDYDMICRHLGLWIQLRRRGGHR